ncbi:hypothetical protein GF1_11980 [Desulfolithobacter dissulfuricans]|uniref:Uncharacterized protein n=1 Tax=Desulfolithobacter dissulfuricans TaxID=2795293 RepID=A0A915U1J7_9BACT|nr:hypothetical protein GF1_11980 [Desulfolithobacter dissulfuricans]
MPYSEPDELDWSIPEDSPFADPDFIRPVEGRDFTPMPDVSLSHSEDDDYDDCY